MTYLTEEQEEKLFKQFTNDGKLSPVGCFHDKEVKAFARLYHTEASKAGMSGEVKSAEEILMRKQYWYHDEVSPGEALFVESEALEAMHDYAAQFQQGWQDMASAPKDGTPVLLKFKDDLTKESRTLYQGKMMVGTNLSQDKDGFDYGWQPWTNFGVAGLATEWFEGWQPISKSNTQ